MIEQPKYKWGISTLGCHELNLPEICELADQHGIHALEIRSLEDRQDLPGYLDDTYENEKAVQSVLDAHRQRIVALNSGFKLIGAEEADRIELLEFARWAELLNIPYIRVFGGGKMEEPLTMEGLDSAASNLQWWHEVRAENQWSTTIALETHTGFSSSERCLKLQAHAGIPIEIIWDTHHTWKQGEETPAQTWDLMASMIRHVHIKDSISVPSARHPYTYVLPGAGEFPAQEALSLLTEHQYDGIVSLEWERKWHPYMPEIGEALEALVTQRWKQDASSATCA